MTTTTAPAAAAEPAQFLNATEVAAILGVQPRTIVTAIELGRFPAIRLGRQYRIPRHALDKLIAAGNRTVDELPPSDLGACATALEKSLDALDIARDQVAGALSTVRDAAVVVGPRSA